MDILVEMMDSVLIMMDFVDTNAKIDADLRDRARRGRGPMREPYV